MLRSFTCTRGMNGGGSATKALSSFWSRTLLVFFAMAPATVPRAPRNVYLLPSYKCKSMHAKVVEPSTLVRAPLPLL
jgi:hypothetical protein